MLLPQLCVSTSARLSSVLALAPRLSSCPPLASPSGLRHMSASAEDSPPRKGLVERVWGLGSNTAAPGTNR